MPEDQQFRHVNRGQQDSAVTLTGIAFNLLPGKFSVASGKQERFSKGNLWCNASASPVTYSFESAQNVTYSTLELSAYTQSHVCHFPKLKEVLERESSDGAPLDKRTVRLVRMGAFIRAYDWSARLLKRYGSPLSAGLDTTDGSTHVFVGFPVASIEKFTPEECETKKDGDGMVEEWIFPATKFPPEEKYDLLEDEYSKWLSETVAAFRDMMVHAPAKTTSTRG